MTCATTFTGQTLSALEAASKSAPRTDVLYERGADGDVKVTVTVPPVERSEEAIARGLREFIRLERQGADPCHIKQFLPIPGPELDASMEAEGMTPEAKAKMLADIGP